MKLLNLLADEQKKLLQNVKGIESFGTFKSTNGISIDPNGITVNDARQIIRTVEKFNKPWRAYKEDSSKVMLQKNFFDKNIAKIGFIERYEIDTESVTAVRLPTPVYKIKCKSYYYEYMRFAVNGRQFLKRSYIGAVVLMVLVTTGVLFFDHSMNKISLFIEFLGPIIFLLAIPFTAYRSLVKKIKEGKQAKTELKALQSAGIARIFPFRNTYAPAERWSRLHVRAVFGNYFSENKFMTKLNQLVVEAVKHGGKLIFFLSRYESDYEFDVINSKLNFRGRFMIGIETNDYYLFDANPEPVAINFNLNENTENEIRSFCNAEGSRIFI